MPDSLESLKEQLKTKDLKYCSDSSPGFFRQKIGKSFKYYNLAGNIIKNNTDLSRIKKLAIPPAWDRVWIAPSDNCHLQATGFDNKNRKQYIYHPSWIKISQENKFDKMVDFGLNLGKIRSKVDSDLRRPKLDKQKILATVLWLLEHTFIRVGNDEYYKDNKTVGLTTLKNNHVRVIGPKIKFSFKGKSGVRNSLEIFHPTIAKTIKSCIELPGYEIFQFVDEMGDRHIIDSSDVNLFLQDLTGGDYSAKDFRTWGATSISANNFYRIGWIDDQEKIQKNISQTVKKVAKHLNNTTRVCKNYYIHPKVFSTYQTNILVPHFQSFSKHKPKQGLSWDEYALVNLLQKY